MKEYIKKVYKTRYFWSHLAMNDLNSRFRRSKLGLLWCVIQPLFFTIILTVVFSTVFHQELKSYSTYILSGIVVWDMLQAGIVSGGNCLFQSEQYIRQFNHPITIYSLRYTILTMITFLLESIALAIWVIAFEPTNLLLAVITMPLTVILFFPIVWGLSTVAGYMGTKYRDYIPVMTLVMQALYYLSPVFFQKEMFMTSSVLTVVFEVNPVTHLLNLIRMPFVYGELPQYTTYLYVLALDILVVLFAYYINKTNERKLIFYL